MAEHIKTILLKNVLLALAGIAQQVSSYKHPCGKMEGQHIYKALEG
jgi:hypothetical protein